MELEIVKIFNESQFSTASHQKHIIALYRILEHADFEPFCKVIVKVLTKILLVDLKIVNNNVQRVIQFFTSFLTYLRMKNGLKEDEENPLLKEVLQYLLKTQSLANHVMRHRSCEIISILFDKLAGQSVSDELFDEIQEALLERTKDPKVDIRLQALTAVHRLQDPNNSEDPVTEEYISAICDVSAKVRKLALEKIAIRRDVLQHIVGRTRDIDAKVRLAAYTRLSKLVKALKIVQRQQVLKTGCIEANQKVKQYVTLRMAPAWFELYNYNYLEIVKALCLDADEKDIANTVKAAEFLLYCLFKTQKLPEILNAVPVDDSRVVPFEKLNLETIIFWRVFVQYLRQTEEFDEVLSKILPDLVNFCEYIQEYCKWSQKSELEQQFILEQLLIIAMDYDIGDVVARESLKQCVNSLLQNFELCAEVIKITMRILERCIPAVETRCYYVSEIISEIMFPTDNTELTQIQDNLIEMKNQYQMLTLQLVTSKNAEDYLKAADYQEQLNELKLAIKTSEDHISKLSELITKKTDSDTVKKYLDIAAALLSSPQITVLIPTLISLKEDVIQECLIHSEESIKAKALKCYALCCLIDEPTAKIGIHICSIPILDYHQGKSCDLSMLTVAIGGVVDMLLIYGFDLLAEPDDENVSESMSEQHRATFVGGTSLTSIIQGLVELMDDENLEVSVLAVKGLCLLVCHTSLDSPSLISRLIIKWANPATDDTNECEIKQVIGNALNYFVHLPNGGSQLKNAVLPTVRTLVRAPKNSPLHEVQNSVIKFLVALCSTVDVKLEIQAQLAVSICDFMKSDPTSVFNVAYTKMLLLLELPNTKRYIYDLLDDCDELLDVVENRKVLNGIRKFTGKLNKLMQENTDVKSEILECVVKTERNEDNSTESEDEDDEGSDSDN